MRPLLRNSNRTALRHFILIGAAAMTQAGLSIAATPSSPEAMARDLLDPPHAVSAVSATTVDNTPAIDPQGQAQQLLAGHAGIEHANARSPHGDSPASRSEPRTARRLGGSELARRMILGRQS